MNTYDLKRATLKQLRETFETMMSPEWDLALMGKSQEEVTQASLVLLSTQRARLRLGNTLLEEIRDKLEENKDQLTQGIRDVQKALTTLGNVGRVLDTVSTFLDTVGKIITLV